METNLLPWHDGIDPATIPDEILKTERGRRNALKRHSYKGGVYWKQHNPAVAYCRCKACMRRRRAQTKKSEK
jgi:hypothetical protein